MKITVVGSGAMGCLFGGYLARAGEDVVLVDAWPEHVRALRQSGLRLWEGDRLMEVPVRAVLVGEPVRPADLILFFVKAYRTAEAAATAASLLADGGALLTLQNGMGSGGILADILGPERILLGVTSQGATVLGPGEVRHGGSGDTLVGAHCGENPLADGIARAFSRAGLPTRAVEDIRPAVWKKLVINCGINALTALAGIKNGRIPEIPEASAVLRDAVREAAAVAAAAGVALDGPEALADSVLAVARATAANRSSMGQDVDRRSPTEIDFINGAVVREGERLGVPAPVNATLTRLIRTLEATYHG